MTKDEVIQRLKEAQDNGDTEMAHSDADEVLCEMLDSLGYADVVTEYRLVSKWYA